jgi:dolichol-phosphate mannosyltransferase
MRKVPDYKVDSYRNTVSEYCVLIPVIDEGHKIKAQLERMQNLSSIYDVIIADGGSGDGSLQDEFLKSVGVRAKLTKLGAGKLSAQMRMGLDFALLQGYKGFIFIDGNNKDNPSAIESFVQKLYDGYDHIQGSRFIDGGRHENTPLLRHFAVRLIHAPLISLAAHYWYTDTTNGFRAYSARFIKDPRVQPFREIFSQYELHYYLAICAGRMGFKTVEVPVERIYPKTGAVPTKIKGFKGNWLVLKTLIKACVGCFDPPKGKTYET